MSGIDGVESVAKTGETNHLSDVIEEELEDGEIEEVGKPSDLLSAKPVVIGPQLPKVLDYPGQLLIDFSPAFG